MRKWVRLFFILLLLVFVVNSLLKATNDPLVSNKWWFYSVQEKEGLLWTQENLKGHSLWADIDSRLPAVYTTFSKVDNHENIQFTGPAADYLFITKLEKERARNVRFPMPDLIDKPVIYDSGEVVIYKN